MWLLFQFINESTLVAKKQTGHRPSDAWQTQAQDQAANSTRRERESKAFNWRFIRKIEIKRWLNKRIWKLNIWNVNRLRLNCSRKVSVLRIVKVSNFKDSRNLEAKEWNRKLKRLINLRNKRTKKCVRKRILNDSKGGWGPLNEVGRIKSNHFKPSESLNSESNYTCTNYLTKNNKTTDWTCLTINLVVSRS